MTSPFTIEKKVCLYAGAPQVMGELVKSEGRASVILRDVHRSFRGTAYRSFREMMHRSF